jgi:hypothetical protein
LDEIPLPPSTRDQFTVTRHRVEFYGYCSGCRRPRASAALRKEVTPAPRRRGKARGKGSRQPGNRSTRSGPRRALGAPGERRR